MPDGALVRDALAADPEGWLGAEHAARFGASPALLVKLLDAGERLPVHHHPDRAFAREQLGSATSARPRRGSSSRRAPARRWRVGWREDVEPDDAARVGRRDQDHDAMLGALQRGRR